jgi:hypothetical protein
MSEKEQVVKALDETIIRTIFTQGTYYNPAWKHYEKKCYVTCDRCLKEKISVCLGLDDNDLCMDCVAELSKI